MQQERPSKLIEFTTFQQRYLLQLGGFLVLTALATTGPVFAQCNSAPVAVDDDIFHTGDPMIIHVLANDSDLDGDDLAVTVTDEDCSGDVTESFGTVMLTPDINSSESCAITYKIDDGREGTDTAVVNIHSTGLLFKDSFETGDTTRWDDVEDGR